MRAVSSAALLVGLCIVAPSLRASISFEGAGGQGTTGNSLSFSDGLFTVTATAWSNTGASGALATAALGQYSIGLGDCNSSEIAATCTSPQHAIDNSGHFDFVLLTFSQPVNSISLSLTGTFGGTSYDTDATYYVGNCTPSSTSCSPSGITLVNLASISGFGANFNTQNSDTSVDGNRIFSLDLSGTGSGGVNWVLIGATTQASYTGNDFFKLDSMTYTTGVPEPATFGLSGAALLGLGLLRARKKRPSTV